MLKASLYLVLAAIVALISADITVIPSNLWDEGAKVLWRAITPDVAVMDKIYVSLINTVAFALCGTFLGAVTGFFLSLKFDMSVVRGLCAFIHAIHEVFWAFLFLSLIGLTPVCGVLAIAVPYCGIFAKVYADIRQNADQHPLEELPIGASKLSRFCFGSFPIIYNDIKQYASYRIECALRSSLVLGFIGLPTLGFHLETAFRKGDYPLASAILIVFYLLVLSKRYWALPKVIVIGTLGSLVFLFNEILCADDRFLWPINNVLFLKGTFQAPLTALKWTLNSVSSIGFEGLINTITVTQIALVGTGLLAFISFPAASRHFSQKFFCIFSQWFLTVVKNTPEYILAYLFVRLWGPSMLSAIVALVLHNGAILAYQISQNSDAIELRFDAPKKQTDRYFFEIIPRIYGRFFAFLFCRWKVMLRESAMIGILGIHTLGFFIFNALSPHHLDTMILLIFISAILNVGIDSVSQFFRRKLKLSTIMTA